MEVVAVVVVVAVAVAEQLVLSAADHMFGFRKLDVQTNSADG
jgi:hypothetical protein